MIARPFSIYAPLVTPAPLPQSAPAKPRGYGPRYTSTDIVKKESKKYIALLLQAGIV